MKVVGRIERKGRNKPEYMAGAVFATHIYNIGGHMKCARQCQCDADGKSDSHLSGCQCFFSLFSSILM